VSMSSREGKFAEFAKKMMSVKLLSPQSVRTRMLERYRLARGYRQHTAASKDRRNDSRYHGELISRCVEYMYRTGGRQLHGGRWD
jgi:hypothetical protein